MKNVNWAKITKIILWVVLGLFAAIAVYDFFPALLGEQATISEITMGVAFKYSFLPYAWGVMTAHFFAPRKRKRIHFAIGIPAVIAIGILEAVVVDKTNLVLLPLVYVVIGGFFGWILWYQQHPAWTKENKNG